MTDFQPGELVAYKLRGAVVLAKVEACAGETLTLRPLLNSEKTIKRKSAQVCSEEELSEADVARIKASAVPVPLTELTNPPPLLEPKA